jgi:hypothetical protein
MKIFLAFFLALLATPAAFTQMPAYTDPGPIPPAIAAAKNIFVSNAGSDSGLFPEPFSGDQNRAYTEFFAALQATKQYALVSDPSQADVVLELHLNAPNGPASPNKQNGASDPVPQFKLVVYDTRTHYVLWSFTQGIEPALLQKTHDKNFDVALDAVLNQFLSLTHRPLVMPPAATH